MQLKNKPVSGLDSHVVRRSNGKDRATATSFYGTATPRAFV